MPCEGCTCGAADNLPANGNSRSAGDGAPGGRVEAGGLAAPEAEAFMARQLRSFTAPSDYSVPSEGIEPAVPLRHRYWFNEEAEDMVGCYIERYTNGGLTMGEIVDKRKPIIGIAQTGSDLAPCNSHHVTLAKRVRDGIIAAGGTPFEFPCHPIQETGKRPTAMLDRNLAYLSLVEVLFGYPLDGVVLLTGCDKTTPAMLMAAATVNIPAICMNVGPMLNGYAGEKLVGSGVAVWDARKALAKGQITDSEMLRYVSTSAPSVGHCNTMGTASTMNALAEALGMALPGSASIPAVYRERGACAYQTGRRIVEMVLQDIKPSDILTKAAFENAIACNTAIGGSTNAPIHLNAIAKHIGVDLSCDDWQRVGHGLPLLLNIQPAGKYLCEEYHRAGGLPAIIAELLQAGALPHPDAPTVNGKTISQNCQDDYTSDRRIILPFSSPLMPEAGFAHLKGNLFDSGIMKTCVISPQYRKQFLSNPNDPMAFEGPVVVFDGPEDYHRRIDQHPDIEENTILIMRGAGPRGYPGGAEVVNMIPPSRLIKRGIELPCIGDGRQSGTCGTPSILNASPEAATGGMLGYLKDGDIVRIDLIKYTADVRITPEEHEKRKKEMGPYAIPESQTPWQEMFRDAVGELSEGMVINSATKYQGIAQKFVPRRNH